MSQPAVTVGHDGLDVSDPAIAAALAIGEAHARAHYATGAPTLIDAIAPDDFAAWDGTDEVALVGAPRK